MRKHEIDSINELRIQGLGSTAIAGMLGMPLNTVKSHIHRHPEIQGTQICPQCGKAVKQSQGRKEKRFCSDRCRMAWWNSHQDSVERRAFYHFTCVNCGSEFESYGNSHRKYCSRACYAEARKKVSVDG